MKRKAFWRTKPILQNSLSSDVKRVFGVKQLTTLAIGVTVGAGLFSLTGIAAGQHAGPAVTLSFLIAAIACTFSALCYAELASIISNGASSYSYAYVAFGEFIAWIIGSVLILGFMTGAATMASSWSSYLASIFQNCGFIIDPRLLSPSHTMIVLPDGTSCQSWFNAPASFIVLIIAALLIRGSETSHKINNFLILLKIFVILAVMGSCLFFVKLSHYTPFIPKNTGNFGEFGISGILRASGMAFFAYLGFDIICTLSQETKNPQRTIPIAILSSQLICALIYITFSAILVGVVDYKTMVHDASPLATAMDITHIPGLAPMVKIGVCLGYLSVIYGMLMAQNRIAIAMTEDGLLPSFLNKRHPKHKTAWYAYGLAALISAVLAGIFSPATLGNMTSLSTLLSFMIVCIGVIILRIKMPHLKRGFKLPGGTYLIPFLGITSCAIVMFSIDAIIWKNLIIFLLVVTLFYFLYGIRHSHLNHNPNP